MEDKINPRESKDGLLESLLGFLNAFFSSGMSGIDYLSPNMRREYHYSTIKVI